MADADRRYLMSEGQLVDVKLREQAETRLAFCSKGGQEMFAVDPAGDVWVQGKRLDTVKDEAVWQAIRDWLSHSTNFRLYQKLRDTEEALAAQGREARKWKQRAMLLCGPMEEALWQLEDMGVGK